MVKFANGQEIKKSIKNQGSTIINIFGTWCGPCKMLAPILEDISENHDVYKVDVDKEENKTFLKEMNVSGIPVTLIYKDGKLVNNIVGFTNKEKILENI